MTTHRHAPLAAALAAVLLAATAPGIAAGFDGAIRNNSLALSPDGRTAAVSNSEESRVLVYDVTSGKLARTLDGFVTPRNIVFAPDGSRFYVSDSGTGRITAYDTATGQEVAMIAAGPGAFGTVLSGDGAKLYVNNEAASTVSVFDTKSGLALAVVPGFSQPSLNLVRSQRCWWVSTTGSMAASFAKERDGRAEATAPAARKSRRVMGEALEEFGAIVVEPRGPRQNLFRRDAEQLQ